MVRFLSHEVNLFKFEKFMQFMSRKHSIDFFHFVFFRCELEIRPDSFKFLVVARHHSAHFGFLAMEHSHERAKQLLA